MSREIKFRVWNNNEDVFHYLEFTDTGIVSEDDPMTQGAVVYQQYTGLKDKDSVEIYEGDIVQWLDNDDGEPNAAEVKYGVGEFDGGHYKYIGFYLEVDGRILEPNEVTHMITDTKWYKYEVIGNIFEGVDK